jgi:hypothetical protein
MKTVTAKMSAENVERILDLTMRIADNSTDIETVVVLGTMLVLEIKILAESAEILRIEEEK